MKLSNILLLIIGMATTGPIWAYGGSSAGGSSKSCTKPKFSQFQPAQNAVVAAEAKFSFLASTGTNPKSIAVTVKGQPVNISVTEKTQGFLVEGQIPADITIDFARINITADGHNRCHGSDGWLVKVE